MTGGEAFLSGPCTFWKVRCRAIPYRLPDWMRPARKSIGSLHGSPLGSLEKYFGTAGSFTHFASVDLALDTYHPERVTGHRTVEVVMKHYFRPGREDFRQVLIKAMPKMLADGGQRSVKEEILAILDGMTARTWRRDRERLREMLVGTP